MKTKRFCKSTVSLILAVMMLVSMFTVGIVNASAAETDVAETGAVTYYFGFTSWAKFHKLNMQGFDKNDDFTSLTNCNTTVSHDIGQNVGNNTYDVYSITVESAYTTAYVTINNNNKSYETAAITLDPGKITLITEWGGAAKFGQTAYGSGGNNDPVIGDFPIDFIEGERKIYLVDQAGWGSSNCYVWNSNNQGYLTWPGESMTDTNKTQTIDGTAYKIYEYDVPSTHTSGVIFYKDEQHRTGDLEFKQYSYYNNSSNTWKTEKPITGGSTEPSVTPTVNPDDPDDPTTLKTLYFMDNSSNSYMTDEDADIYAKFNTDSKSKAMKQRVDTISGKTLWSIKVPSGATSVTFTRKTKLGATLGNGTWSNVPLSGKSTGYYKASSGGSGSWENDESTFSPSSDSDITNFWYGVWVDSKGEENGTDAVRWWKDSNGKYHIFLPTHTSSTFKLYTSFNEFKISSLNKTVTKGTGVELSNITYGQSYSATYQAKAGGSTTACSVTFHKSENVSSLMLFTDDQLWTKTIYSSIPDVSGYKDGIETKGSIYLYDNEGNLVNNVITDKEDQTVLKKFKGRGNSSFEASMKMYGKYAYNFNLKEKVDLTKLPDGSNSSTAAKKWCLLANNVDHAMLRNTFTYNLANDIGLAYSPKTRHVDVYDNGEYIGAYTIIEKVEYGKNTLMKDLKNLDDEHEGWYEKSSIYDEDVDYDDDSVIKSVGSKNSPITYTTSSGNTYKYKYWTSKVDGFTYEHADDSFKTKFNFLLEHELDERYDAEASWFISAKGQHVVVKYPEFATQKEMKWAMDMYDKLEKAAYSTKTLASIEAAADAESFAKMYLIQELGLNLDACATSYYIYNDRATNKLVAGPTWDFDWSFGSYHKTKVTYNGTSSSLDNPRQMYVKDKDMNNNISGGRSGTRNLQAQLTQTTDYWTLCKKIWTNDAQPAIKTYIDENTKDSTDTGTLLGWMNDIEASAEMNNIRWNHAYEKDEPEDWGTKLTSNYNKGSYDFKPGTGNSAGSASKSYKNTVYYLNDWIKTRMDYMSTTGGLYDATLEDPYDLNSAVLSGKQSGNKVTVSVVFDAEYNDVQVIDAYKAYDLYVNGSLYKEACAITETPTITLEENKETSIYAIAYLTGDKDKYNLKSNTEKFTYTVSGPEYKVENVKFDYKQSADESTVTVTPAAYVTVDGVELKPAEINYTIYLNGSAYVTKTFETPSVDVKLVEGKVNEIYIKVSPVASPNTLGTSLTYKFSFNVPVEKVTATINFKSSGSLRYVPQFTVNKEKVDASKVTKGALIGKNKTQTQSYYWYTVEIEIEKDAPTTLTISNEYNMNATTTLKLSENKTLKFAVDNLNDGTTIVDLTDVTENIQNFKLSASHMVYNDPSDPELATTSINGTVYKMGDANEDNKLNISDATAIQRSLAEIDDLTETGEALADFNLDGVTSIMDVTNEQIKLAN